MGRERATMVKDSYEPTGKSKKAKNRLDAVDKEIKGIKVQLDNALIAPPPWHENFNLN